MCDDFTCNGVCSRCGECCSMFIPLTDEEVATVKKYVEKHNIKPTRRLEGNNLKVTCAFYDSKNKCCNIYEVRPYACRKFSCANKDWKAKRDEFEKRAKYNNSFNPMLATFDDLIYNDYTYIIRYLISLLPNKNGIDSIDLLKILKLSGRLDLLKYISVESDGRKIQGIELLDKEI